jgi:hypothetical protein
MQYPYRTGIAQAILEHMPSSPYASDDHPYLSTERYSIVGYEPRDVADKKALDAQGAAANYWWYLHNQQMDRAVNFGQR